MLTYDPHDPGSNLGSGDSCFLFLSIESDSKSHRDYNFLLRVIQFYNIMVQCSVSSES